jgi:hypothetical protein
VAVEYPQRDMFFSHRFVRLLMKSCAALDMGPAACLLLCYIVHTEDAAKYRGAVRFWNQQLMTVMGFKSPKQLIDARTKAVEAGWLVYERSGNREVGQYWVTIPDDFEGLSDGLIESNHSVNHVESGTNSGTNTKRKAERIGDGSRNEYETESGKHSIPIPVPIPKPETQGDAVGSSVSQVVPVNAADAAPVKAQTRRITVFVKPTICEVAAYVQELNATVDAKTFCDYYESNGWRVGRNPMKDWRATVRQWQNRNQQGSLYSGNERAAGNSAIAKEARSATAFSALQQARERAGISVPASGPAVRSVGGNIPYKTLLDEEAG